MRKVSFSFPPDLVDAIDTARGDLSRNQFVARMLKENLKERREAELARIADEVYSTTNLAEEDRAISEDFLSIAPEIEP